MWNYQNTAACLSITQQQWLCQWHEFGAGLPAYLANGERIGNLFENSCYYRSSPFVLSILIQQQWLSQWLEFGVGLRVLLANAECPGNLFEKVIIYHSSSVVMLVLRPFQKNSVFLCFSVIIQQYTGCGKFRSIRRSLP